MHRPSPGSSPQWGHRLGNVSVPLDGAVAGLKAKLAFPSSDFALLHDALFSMSWHAALWPRWQVLLPRAASWHSWCAASLRPAGSGGFLARGAHRRQRPSIRARARARHPMLSASFDACWQAQRRRPPRYDGVRGRPGTATGRLHQHQGRSVLQHRPSAYASLRTAPAGKTPVSRKRQSAMSHWRATATSPIRLKRWPPPPKRSRNQPRKALSGCKRRPLHANSVVRQRTGRLPDLVMPCSRARAPL